MYPRATVAAVLELGSIGMDCAWIARELGIPRRTIDRWLKGQTPRVERPHPVPSDSYAYLLGVYLGDGHLSAGARGQPVLTISCDAGYTGIVRSIREAVRSVCPGRQVWLATHPVHRCVRVICWSRWWPLLFPQHGNGRKHTRRIVLTEWQRAITRLHARDLVRGLIHSDGSRFVAKQRVGAKVYSYARYSFSNRSDDIRAIFCEHLDLLRIGWTRPSRWDIAVDRRSEVAKLDAFVGPKR